MDLTAGQRVEWARIVHPNLSLFFDVDLGEERLVAQATVRVITTGVDVGRLLQQIQGVVQVVAGIGVLVVVRIDPVLDRVQARRDAILLLLQQVQWYRTGVVGLEQLDSLFLQPVPLLGQVCQGVGLRSHELVELIVQVLSDGLTSGSADLHGLVVAFDQPLDFFDEHGLAGAAAPS